MKTKICIHCNVRKRTNSFYFNKTMRDGLRSTCKECDYKYTQEWREANPQRGREHQRKGRLKRRYGLTLTAYAALKEAQGNCCAACGISFQSMINKHIHVDHDHASGKIRGILCRGCNVALGAMTDDPVKITSLLKYIERQHERTTL